MLPSIIVNTINPNADHNSLFYAMWCIYVVNETGVDTLSGINVNVLPNRQASSKRRRDMGLTPTSSPKTNGNHAYKPVTINITHHCSNSFTTNVLRNEIPVGI